MSKSTTRQLLVTLLIGPCIWPTGCSVSDTSTQDHNPWQIEERSAGGLEPREETALEPVLTDDSEPQDIHFVFHPLSRARAPIRWSEDRDHVQALNKTGRALDFIALAFNYSESRWRDAHQIPAGTRIWIGVKFPPELSYDDAHHVFECPAVGSSTTRDRTHLENKVVYCSLTTGTLRIHILDHDASQLEWFDTVTQGFIDAARRGDVSEYLEHYVRAGNLPWWEASIFIQREDGPLVFQSLAQENRYYLASFSQHHEKPLLRVHARSVIK